MGGHGGLNILPQKSWNVYNWDNREKVRKDELAHAFDEEQRREQRLQHEREFRRQVLLRRARRAPDEGAPAAEEGDEEGDLGRGADAGAGGHVTLFDEAEYERRLGAEDADAARRKAKQRENAKKLLGREATAAEERRAARFEEGFRLGGAHGELSRAPWYLAAQRPASPRAEDHSAERGEQQQQQQQQQQHRRLLLQPPTEHKRRRRSMGAPEGEDGASADDDSGDDEDEDGARRRRKRRKAKHKRQHKEHRRSRSGTQLSDGTAARTTTKRSVAELRAERELRELKERKRQAKLLVLRGEGRP